LLGPALLFRPTLRSAGALLFRAARRSTPRGGRLARSRRLARAGAARGTPAGRGCRAPRVLAPFEAPPQVAEVGPGRVTGHFVVRHLHSVVEIVLHARLVSGPERAGGSVSGPSFSSPGKSSVGR